MAAPIDALSRHLFGFERPAWPGERGYHRTVEAVVVGLSMLFAWRWATLASRLNGVVVPTGLGHYVDMGWLQGPTIPFVWAGLVTLLLGAGFVGIWRGAYLMALVAMHLLHAAHEVLGKVSHASHLVAMALLGLGLAAVFFPARPQQGRLAIGFTLFFLGFGYVLAGICKLLGTGVMWADGLHLWMWTHEKHVDGLAKHGHHAFNVFQQLVLSSRALATAFLAFGWLVELSAWLVWFRRFRVAMLLLIAGMHVGIYVTMGIAFRQSTLLCLVLAIGPAVARYAARSKADPDPVEAAVSGS